MLRRAFALVELLVVIAIIGLLSSVAIVAMGNSRSKARIAAGQVADRSIYNARGDYLEGEWLFNGGLVNDTSNNGRNGAVAGATAVTGYDGKTALSFNGTTNYVDIPFGWQATGQSFTVTAWVYDTGSGINEIVFDASSGRVSMEIRSGNIACLTNNDAWKSGSNDTLQKNVWNFVVCTFDASTAMISGYMNGARQFSLADNAPSADPTQIRINGNVSGNFRLTGYIDDVRLYSNSLSASSLRKLFAEGRAGQSLNIAQL